MATPHPLTDKAQWARNILRKVSAAADRAVHDSPHRMLSLAKWERRLSPTTPQPSEPRPRITDAGAQAMNEALGLDDTRAHKPGKRRAARVVQVKRPPQEGTAPEELATIVAEETARHEARSLELQARWMPLHQRLAND